jgi:hypothetical protein
LTGDSETPAAVTAVIPEATTAPDVQPTTGAAATATAGVEALPTTGPSEPGTETPTEAATVEAEQTAEPGATTGSEPVLAPPGSIAPGQQTGGMITAGEFQVYRFQGTEFQPALVFVEGDDGLDIAVGAYPGVVAAGTDLNQLIPQVEANFSGAGRPEIMVVTPEEDGEFSIVVRGDSGTAGVYTLYMYDGTTPAANTQLFNDSLAAGETKSYSAESNGGRPVIVYVDQSGQSDLSILIINESGAVVGEANFGSAGSAETVFVLPLETAGFTIQISETTGAVASYDLVIVTLN